MNHENPWSLETSISNSPLKIFQSYFEIVRQLFHVLHLIKLLHTDSPVLKLPTYIRRKKESTSSHLWAVAPMLPSKGNGMDIKLVVK